MKKHICTARNCCPRTQQDFVEERKEMLKLRKSQRRGKLLMSDPRARARARERNAKYRAAGYL